MQTAARYNATILANAGNRLSLGEDAITIARYDAIADWYEEFARGAALRVDSIQVGLSRQIIERYVNEWTVEIRDCTPLADKLRDLIARETR